MTVAISIGDGVDLRLDHNDLLHLNVQQAGILIDIPLSNGKCSQARIDFIKECLDRIRTHCPERVIPPCEHCGSWSIRCGCD